MTNRTKCIAVGLIAIAVGSYITVSLLAGNGWDPSIFIKFAELDPQEIAYGTEQLGEVVPAPGDGHDGKYYFMQARDPFYGNPDSHAYLLDRPTYRAQRMLYPTLAGGFGMFPAEATAWGLVVLNVVALGIGTWLTAKLAIELGISAWFGLGFLFNPGVLVSSFIDTAEVLAMIFFVGAAILLIRKRYTAAALSLTLATLSRETMIVAAIGAIVYVWRENRRVQTVFALPFLASGLWWLFLRVRIGYLTDSVQDTQAIGLPFSGFIDAMRFWLSEPGREIDLLVGVVLLLTSILIAWRATRQRSVLGYMTAGFAVLAVLMVQEVWRNYFDAARALAPVLTAYILMVPASRNVARQDEAIQPQSLSA